MYIHHSLRTPPDKLRKIRHYWISLKHNMQQKSLKYVSDNLFNNTNLYNISNLILHIVSLVIIKN